ncbi:uncharacterized protein LOC110247432 [Exaiptasia diaphana]|uniref:L-ectoine synthase n=1 Tax=Exaiptasia diaphana TaxID=2652724 RepID=A0A913XTI9_EXADI|nr:uncharacterized protein LOC110247432 [Exaiptasia diaphana]
MKSRILSELPDEQLGQTTLSGKILTFLEDNVGFFEAQFLLEKDQSHDLTPVYQDHNHIYYCINGKASVKIDQGDNQFTLTDNTLLALSPSTKASITALASTRLVVVSVPGLPNQQPVVGRRQSI